MPQRKNGAGRAQGQGSPYNRGRGGGRGRGRGRGGFYPATETDFIVQMYGENTVPGGYHTPHGQARRGIGSPPANYNSYSAPPSGYSSPRGKGGRGRGSRGRGRGDGPLSQLLYEDRPYLRPIKFVPSVNTRILFQEQEEILKPIVEEVGDEEECHVPTAERVAHVFSGVSKPPTLGDDLDGHDESLEEIDFNDLSAFQQKIDMEATSISQLNRAEQVDVEDKFTGAFFDPVALREVAIPEPQDDMTQDNTAEPAPADEGASVIIASSITVHTTTEVVVVAEEIPAPVEEHTTEVQPTPEESTSTLTKALSRSTPMEDDTVVLSTSLAENVIASPPSLAVDDREPVETHDEKPSVFFVDTTPTPTPIVVSTSTSLVVPLGAAPEDEDDVIVYEGPHPRSGVATPISKPAAPALPSLSFSPSPHKFARRPHPAHSKTKSKLKERRQAAWTRKHRGSGSFAALGANVAEAQLYEDKDPRQDERRRGDSDVDWGDETDNEVDEVANGVDGMDLDPELELDVEALKRFACGLDANFKTMDDINDEERIKKEDEEDGSSESESENDDEDEESARRAIEEDEAMMLGDSDAEEDLSPNSSFQRQLQRIRESSNSKRAGKSRQADEDADSSDDEDDFFRNQTWAEEDDDFIAHIHDILDENESTLSGRERQKKKAVFGAIHNGTFDDEWMPQARRKKDKYKDLTPELQEQWEKDRQKKAERKRERELARLSQAADPSAANKGGKKGRKAMLAAAALDPTITVIPNRIIDVTTLVQQIRRFIANIGGPQSMSLPPADKKTRKNVHELAVAFNLKSVSKGKGDARYTTLTKTTMTGTRTNEAAISRIMRRGGNFGDGGEFVNKKGKGKGNNLLPRHKEGDEVGKEAPRIGQSNIGFRMLASMGWSEGDHIGMSGGLKDPVTAVIKNTKLGLGATK
ncbi:hypothetical protein F5146DRAFT_1015527 [Armillaria mellea]|nr:hypothetical protein F5146DRAFT_1015527 [Armillaria mellea]